MQTLCMLLTFAKKHEHVIIQKPEVKVGLKRDLVYLKKGINSDSTPVDLGSWLKKILDLK